MGEITVIQIGNRCGQNGNTLESLASLWEALVWRFMYLGDSTVSQCITSGNHYEYTWYYVLRQLGLMTVVDVLVSLEYVCVPKGSNLPQIVVNFF